MEKRSKTGLQSKYDYISRYQKENYSMFSASLKKEEYVELKEMLKQKGMTNADFIRYAMEKLRSM